MKPIRTITVILLTSLGLLGCSSTQATDDAATSYIRLQSENVQLQRAARQTLHSKQIQIDDSDTALPLLWLDENSTRTPGSIAADGSISDYKIRYTLTYQLADAAPRQITREEVVSYDNNAYRASQQQQDEMINSLRRGALIQMLIALGLR